MKNKNYTQLPAIRFAKWVLAFFVPFMVFQTAQAQNYVGCEATEPYTSIFGQGTFLTSGDDVTGTITLPFTFTFYGTSYTNVKASTNGFLVFPSTGTTRSLANGNLPTSTAYSGAAMYPFWDDLDAGPSIPSTGIYYLTEGAAPNRVFTIEWYHVGHFNDVSTQYVTFQVKLYETTNDFKFCYDDVFFGGSQAIYDRGASATVGIEGPPPAPRPFTLYSYNQAVLNNGTCISFKLPPAACVPVAGADLSVSTDPDNCEATVNLALPTFSPGGCEVGNGLRYSVDGGTFVDVPAPFTGTITLTGLTAPATHEVVWEVYDLNCTNLVLGTDAQFIDVTDMVDPVVNCPANMLINLDPGLCSAFVNYNITATDNCPFLVTAPPLYTVNVNNNAGSVGGQVFFDVTNNAGYPLTVTELGMKISTGTMVNIYMKSGTYNGFQTNAGAWTLVGQANATVGPFAGPYVGQPIITPAPCNFTIPTGTWGIALGTPSAQQIYTNGTGANQTFSDANITINLGSAQNAPWSGSFTPRVWNGYIQYQVGAEAEIIQTSGLESGSEFPIGTTTNCFETQDIAGNVGTCCFDVTVLEFPNPTETLACNDNVQISLDETGCVEVLADMILEGGPYGCYDNYVVEILNQFGFPTGNTVCCSDVGITKTVRVTDPATGNKCWGTLITEDKLPPIIQCTNFSVSCTEAIEDLPSPQIPGIFEEVIEGLNDPIGAPSGPTQQEYTFDLSYLPAGHPVLDVNCRIKLTGHTWLPDLDILVINPGGNQVDCFAVTGCFGTEYPIDVWWDDEGTGGLTQCVQLNAGGAHLQCFQAPGVQSPTVLSALDGTDASGIWTVRITDAIAPDDGVIEIVGLRVETPELAQVDPTDNCDVVDLSFTESIDNPGCDGPSQVITRVWTATDPSGNTASCVQTITRVRPTLADIEFPPSYDGVNNPALDCSGNPWDTNGNGYPDPEETGTITITGAPFVNEDICEMTATFEDLYIPICEGTFKVVRKWLVIDWCKIEQVSYDQVLKVADQTGPEVDCPAGPLTINVYQGSYNQGPGLCKGNVVIQPLNVLGDDCSSPDPSGYKTELWTLGGGQLIASINGNGGTFNNVELIADNPPTNNAQYTVRHIFKDNCGNQSECQYNITVVDKVPPVPICDEITDLAITNNGGSGEGCSTLPASDLDDGSYDNCGDVYFYAAKMNPFLTPPYFYQYYPTLEFCCSEIGDNMVVVLVLDFDPTTVPGATLPDGSVFLFPGNPIFEGSFNTCMVTVQVNDKIPPVTLFCPQGATITCDEYLANYASGVEQGDYSVLDGFGTPQFYDNCDYDLTSDVTVNLNNCTEGSITRSWTASDANGQATCTQTITVNHVSDWVVEFPDNFTGQCVNGQLPDTGEPQIFHDECELIGVSHSDELFTVVPDACYKIVRTWNVINWCVYDDFGYDAYSEAGHAECNLFQDWDGDGDQDCRTFRDGYNSTGNPGTPDGYISYKQVIKVIDNEAPTFTVPAIDGCITDTDCNTDLTLPYPDITDDCSLANEVTITGDFGTFANITGDVTVANVEIGQYEVTYAVTDNCGNTGYETVTIDVTDCKKPTPLCDNGLVVEIMQTGMVEVCAIEFDEGSFDNCCTDLTFSYSPDVNDNCHTYTCDDLGQQPVQIWVTDCNGVQDYCETFLVVQDNMFSCNSVNIAGAVATEAEAGVEGVNVEVNGGIFSEFTDQAGNFSFDALVPGGDYTVTPMLDENPGNGVTTWDLVLISRHILGIQLLDSPYKLIAADANKSNSVTTLDMVNIRKVILQLEPGFPNNTSWRFVDKDYVFPNPANPFGSTFPEVINYNNLSTSDLNADFVAVKVGDVNGSAVANLNSGAEDRTFNGSLNINVQDQQLKAGKTYTVNFTADAIDLLGYQFTLNYNTDAVEIVDLVEGVAGAENFGMLSNEGVLTTSWNVSEARALAQGEVLFGLTVKANADVALSEAFGVSSAYTVAEAYNSNSDLLDVNLTFNGSDANAFALYQNVPNPFKGVTVIGFTLPEASTATLKVMDVSGKVLQVVSGDYAKGYNEVRLSNIDATGVLYYQLDTPTHSATKKMIIIE
ncbi:MAG: HYR domain-containing protein [Lewinellaceae bacterium]|nr:HYR domain-containing protein [Lewinellaceae bacterium]